MVIFLITSWVFLVFVFQAGFFVFHLLSFFFFNIRGSVITFDVGLLEVLNAIVCLTEPLCFTIYL